MLGIKEKISNFVDRRIEAYLKSKKIKEKAVEAEITEADISMAEAELKNISGGLDKALGYSFQRGLESLTYTKNKETYAMDSIDSSIKKNTMCGMRGITGSPKDIVFSFFAQFGYIGWQICSVLAQHWLISKACNISNKDCLRNGWNNIFIDKKDKIESEEEKDKNQDVLNKIYDIEQQEFHLNDKLLKWGFFINVFGTAYLLPKIDGIDYEKPFNIDGIKKGSFKGLSVIEPYWMIPQFDLDNITDVTDINFFEPEYYVTNKGEKIHKSHLIIGRRKFVSDILKPSYYFGGISLAQEMYERVYASERSANEAPLLLLTKRLNVYKTKLKNVFANPKHYKDLMEVITDMRDNQGILFADKDDDVSQIDTTLSDLDEVIMKQYQICSAIAEVPVDKLFETNPTGGLSASGDYNIKNYNQNLNTLQADRFKPAIDRINEIVMKSYFDKKDRIGIVFNPTDNPTEKEIADLNKQKADMDTIYIQNGVITPEEARQRLVNDKMSGYSFLKGVDMEEPTEEEQQELEQMMNKEDKKEGKDEDDVEWITVKGNHIPLGEGESKKEAIENFIDRKESVKKNDKSVVSKKENMNIVKKEEKEYNGITKSEVKTAKTEKEAEQIAKDLNLANTISYKGLGVDYANEINKTVYLTIQEYPEIKNGIKTLGAYREINKIKQAETLKEKKEYIKNRVEKVFSKQIEQLQKTFGKKTEEIVKEKYGSFDNMKLKINEEVLATWERAVGAIKPVRLTYRNFAQTVFRLEGATERCGIYFNDKNFPQDKLKEVLKENVKHKGHPEGCDTIKSVIDHELGHHILYTIISKNKSSKALKEIKDIFEKAGSVSDITEKLSSYGAKSFDEFVAEAYSEFKNNKKPRPLALKVGQLLDKAYKEVTKDDKE